MLYAYGPYESSFFTASFADPNPRIVDKTLASYFIHTMMHGPIDFSSFEGPYETKSNE